ncbi:biofilm PGA synthesis lipoprotein PgaB [Thermanaeromonas toyohensis ToBE]|uniref:Biofilm PGA synthesis lipoprotein PgaB n=1 Tax=Thermanaeromonas toyohensis ToBE TaxID=698762 RepID=A0A1W1W319_9FIRM|nr:polysaccharide deacetylase family protein [Thermanaeromonas toyohensis]SMC00017.1 biofilm PGA synthesis lipoprotein PgaB [Thermanaeromonas toyohensis ToBE]
MKKFYPAIIFCVIAFLLLAIQYRAVAARYSKVNRAKAEYRSHLVSSTLVTSNVPENIIPAEVPRAGKTNGQGPATPEGPILYRDKVVALIYHHFASPESDVTISRERLVSHLELLASKGYRVITLEDLLNFFEGRPLPPNAVLITIDDGYSSVYEVAFPELRYRKMPAVVFVIGAYMGKTINNLHHFGWLEAREMEGQGIAIHSHTYNQHHFGRGRDGVLRPFLEGPLAGETDQDFEKRVLQDLTKAKQELENNLGHTIYALAWPYGRASSKARDIAARLGFKLIFTTQYGVITRHSNPLNLPRINVGSPRVTAAELDLLLRRVAGVTENTRTAEGRKP